jgi:hypothetical protein
MADTLSAVVALVDLAALAARADIKLNLKSERKLDTISVTKTATSRPVVPSDYSVVVLRWWRK